MRNSIRLKYLCASFSTPITQEEINKEEKYPVFGAGGIVGYKKEYACEQEYLGIIKDGAGVGRVGKYRGHSSLLGTMAYIVPNKATNIDWLKYVLIQLDLGKSASLTTIPHIYFKDYGNRLVANVDIKEQQRIAEYLDRKCAEIDAVIADTQKTIDEYKALKQSIITEAVTKGIRPNRPMKDSGVEWIGMMPNEWDSQRLKYVAHCIQVKYDSSCGDMSYIGLENIVSWNGKYIETDSKYDQSQSFICEEGDILFGKLRPYLAKVYISPKRQCCSSEFVVFRVKNKYHNRFYWYQLISHGFVFMVDRSTYGTKMPRANAEYIKNIEVSIPPTLEQIEIAYYLDNRCLEMDKVIDAKQQVIANLEFYKRSLIYEYVTGKKEVPVCP